MSYKYTYAWEKFNRAIYSLAIGKEEITKRLLPVFEGDLLMIEPEKHLPNKVRDTYKEIQELLSKYDEAYKGQKKVFETDDVRLDHFLPTRTQASLHRMRGSTGEKIAKKLFYIYDVLNKEFNI